ncbi:MAG: hypothetical protein EB090_01700 [Verrucomicrobia bacterium]|nr:hypothetical protein [Verrucomicrobiota bacterium]
MPAFLRETLPWLLAAMAIVFSLVAPQGSIAAAPWIFLSSAVILGVPHGACDPWIPGWVLHRPSRPLFLLIFFSVYLALSVVYLVLWRIFPLPSTFFFLILTAWHWGSADASFEIAPGSRWLGLAVARGSLVMLAPFAAHPDEAWQVVRLMAPGAAECPPRSFFLAGVALALTLQLFSRSSWKSWMETFLLLCLFYFAPPLLSVGIYFMAFHAWRHLLRLTALRDHLVSDKIHLWIKSLARLLLLSAPLTLATLLFLPWIPHWAHSQIQKDWVGPYLILLAVLTLPHAVLVGWMDKKAPFIKS